MNRTIAFIVLLGLGCGGSSGDGGRAADSTVVADTALPDFSSGSVVTDSGYPRDSLVMPPLPEPLAGRLVAVSYAGTSPDFEIAGDWEAWAVRCEEPSIVQIIARGDGFGAAVLVALPDSSPAATAYAVSGRDRGVPGEGSARVGYQVYGGDDPYVFRGDTGTVRVARLDSVISGTVASQITETTLREDALLSASFEDIPVRMASPEECQMVPSRDEVTPPRSSS